MRKRDELTKGCMAKALDDEMCFVLLGRDAAAPGAIREWARHRVGTGKNQQDDPLIVEAMECARTMEAERDAVRERLKREGREGRMADEQRGILQRIVDRRSCVLTTATIDAVETALAEIDALRAELAEARRLISEEPRTPTLLPPWFQRLWEACVTLSEKAAVKDFVRHVDVLEKQIAELQRLRDAAPAPGEAMPAAICDPFSHICDGCGWTGDPVKITGNPWDHPCCPQCHGATGAWKPLRRVLLTEIGAKAAAPEPGEGEGQP